MSKIVKKQQVPYVVPAQYEHRKAADINLPLCIRTKVPLPLMWIPVGAMMRHQPAKWASINTFLKVRMTF